MNKTMTASSPLQSTLLPAYLTWVHTWLHHSFSDGYCKAPPPLDIGTISTLLQDQISNQPLDPRLFSEVIISFEQRFKNGEIALGGVLPPSCAETNLLSEKYDPRVECTCDGISPMSSIRDADLMQAKACRSIERMLLAHKDVAERCQEWKRHGLFTLEKLQAAVEEITFCNLDIQELPTICSGASVTSIPPIEAPDRRPSPKCDNAQETYNGLFPTSEQIKLCADAKYFHAIACGGSLVDEGILRAIADAGNDVLIGNYCEAAPADTLYLLQRNGAAAVAFLKVCNLAGLVSDWQLDILVAAHIHFRVLGYYRNHAVRLLPEGLHGSRMTGLIVHRHIDIANTVGVVAASLATGEQLDEAEYMKLSYGTTLINDLVDFRSDTMRKQRENPIVRGVRGSACQYLNKQILDCLICVRELIESKRLLAMVTMAFCNWTVMASHHKLYELTHGVRENTELSPCEYDGLDEQYDLLVRSLQPYGSLGPDGPQWGMKRMELDKKFSIYRQSPETHSAWTADMVRLLVSPSNFRRLVDVVHYSWTGEIGEAEYCP